MRSSSLMLLGLAWLPLGWQEVKMPKAGDQAPVLRLNNHDGKAVEVGQATPGSWTILAFYPKAATPG